MRKFELTVGQMMACESLSTQAKDRCRAFGMEAKRCEPKHFMLLVFRYGEKISRLASLMDDCLIWCQSRGLRQFTPARFANWCKIELSKYERQQSKFREMDQLKHGNQHQRAEYARRMEKEGVGYSRPSGRPERKENTTEKADDGFDDMRDNADRLPY